jgi:hypothetical protein
LVAVTSALAYKRTNKSLLRSKSKESLQWVWNYFFLIYFFLLVNWQRNKYATRFVAENSMVLQWRILKIILLKSFKKNFII